jgi:hypothetical protein
MPEDFKSIKWGKRFVSFPGVTCSPEAKPAPFGAAGRTVDQYRAKPLQREVVQPICELEQESQPKFRAKQTISLFSIANQKETVQKS